MVCCPFETHWEVGPITIICLAMAAVAQTHIHMFGSKVELVSILDRKTIIWTRASIFNRAHYSATRSLCLLTYCPHNWELFDPNSASETRWCLYSAWRASGSQLRVPSLMQPRPRLPTQAVITRCELCSRNALCSSAHCGGLCFARRRRGRACRGVQGLTQKIKLGTRHHGMSFRVEQVRIAADCVSRAIAAAELAEASAARAALVAMAAFSKAGLPLAAITDGNGGAAASAGTSKTDGALTPPPPAAAAEQGAAGPPAGAPLAPEEFPFLARMGMLAGGSSGDGGGGGGAAQRPVSQAPTGPQVLLPPSQQQQGQRRQEQVPSGRRGGGSAAPAVAGAGPAAAGQAAASAAGQGTLAGWAEFPQLPRDEAVLHLTERVRLFARCLPCSRILLPDCLSMSCLSRPRSAAADER